jgi:hypothetical protein
MSTAPSKTGCYDSFAANLKDKTEPATSTQPATGATTALAAPSAYEAQAALSGALMDGLPIEEPTNLPLGVSELTLMFTDGTPIKGNTIPLRDEKPVRFTVKFANRPEGVDYMVMNVIISELSKDSYKKGGSGSFSKYVRSMTYEDTVPIMEEKEGYSISIEVGHATAPSSGWHGGDGPYDVYVSFTPVITDGQAQAKSIAVQEKAMSAAAENDDDDEYLISQIDETLRYTFYKPETHFLVRLYYAVQRFWNGF